MDLLLKLKELLRLASQIRSALEERGMDDKNMLKVVDKKVGSLITNLLKKGVISAVDVINQNG
jgi:hypothetical protein